MTASAGRVPEMTGDWSRMPSARAIAPSSGHPDERGDERRHRDRDPEDADHALLVGPGDAFLLLLRHRVFEVDQEHPDAERDGGPLEHALPRGCSGRILWGRKAGRRAECNGGGWRHRGLPSRNAHAWSGASMSAHDVATTPIA